jgi:hypothetical protein
MKRRQAMWQHWKPNHLSILISIIAGMRGFESSDKLTHRLVYRSYVEQDTPRISRLC